MWNWIKNIFKPRRQYPDIASVKPNTVIISKKPIDQTGMTKGDIKRLKGQGKI